MDRLTPRARCRSSTSPALSGDGRTAWVSARGENAVFAFSLSNLTRGRLAVGDSPVGLAVQPGDGRLWVSDSSRFEDAEGDVRTVNATPPVRIKSGRYLRFLPDGRTLVVAVFGSEAVQLIPVPG